MSQAGWQELRLRARKEQVPDLEDWLFAAGAVAVTLEDDADEPLLEPGVGETPLWQSVHVIALFTEGVDLKPIIAGVPAELVTELDPTPVHVPDQDWERAWMDDFHPMQMGERLWICPSWVEPPAPDAVNVLLDPGLAFGTGTHPTTAMCLGALDGLARSGMRLVDYGCGTGILAIAGIKLGAVAALCVDNDPQALVATRQNAERNGVMPESLSITTPDDDALVQWQGSADIVVANILAGPLGELKPTLAALLKPGGQLILAGLLEAQAQALIETYAGAVALEVTNDLEGWVLLTGAMEATG